MKPGPALENLTGAIVEICRSGLAPDALREQAFARLRRAVPFDAAFWATVDPTTLLFTRPHQEEIPPDTVPYFIQNEFLDKDVNKWTALARDPVGVRTLVEATGGDVEASARFRDIFRSLGLGDELRAVLRVGGACWGYLCLHRAAGAAFSREEARYVRRLAPHLGEGIRAGILASRVVENTTLVDVPGLILMAPDGSLISTTAAGDLWLDELGHPEPARRGLPVEVHLLAATFARAEVDRSALPRLRMQTRAGRWAVLHASRLPAEGAERIAVIIDELAPAELAPVLMMAYGLTRQEQTVTRLACRGVSTREMGQVLSKIDLRWSWTVFGVICRRGVRSRRELVTAVLQEQYLPRAMRGEPVGGSGRR